jgi:hypothetical protein
MAAEGFETDAARMVPMFLLTLQAPVEDVDRIMEGVIGIAPLAMGKYDGNAYQSGEGIERYRPLEGAAAGPETELRKRPGVVAVSFELPLDRSLLERVIDAIFQVHSYEEPVIRVETILSSRSKGLDDRSNPNRWWNRAGDWKTPGRSQA